MVKKLVLLAVMVGVLSINSAAFADDVYVTKNGKRYHAQACNLIKNRQVTAIEESAAMERKMKPCERCFKAKANEKLSKHESKKSK